ncbi:MAG TPA: type IV pilin protein [Tahibacter sp.]|nr:type IV pilin protein [Tahibacter sp.]
MRKSPIARTRFYRGFTLIELMVAVAVVAILSMIALPAYNDYVRRSKLVEAQSGLQDFRVRMEQYFQDNRNYGTGGGCGLAIATLESAQYFDFTCTRTAGPPEDYTATATGKTAAGVAGFTFTIRADNTRATTALPAGWGAVPKPCWVARKGGNCT